MEEFWVHSDVNGVDKVSYSYSDYVSVPTYVFVSEMVLFILWVVTALFLIISLVGKGISGVIRKIRHKVRGGGFVRWNGSVWC